MAFILICSNILTKRGFTVLTRNGTNIRLDQWRTLLAAESSQIVSIVACADQDHPTSGFIARLDVR